MFKYLLISVFVSLASAEVFDLKLRVNTKLSEKDEQWIGSQFLALLGRGYNVNNVSLAFINVLTSKYGNQWLSSTANIYGIPDDMLDKQSTINIQFDDKQVNFYKMVTFDRDCVNAVCKESLEASLTKAANLGPIFWPDGPDYINRVPEIAKEVMRSLPKSCLQSSLNRELCFLQLTYQFEQKVRPIVPNQYSLVVSVGYQGYSNVMAGLLDKPNWVKDYSFNLNNIRFIVQLYDK